MGTNLEKRKLKKLKMEHWSLEKKIKHAKKRIVEFHTELDGMTFIGFSGGKDSVVLRHLVLSLYPQTPCVFSNTTNEYAEILQFIRTIPNVIWVKPKQDFISVMENIGFPLVSKKVARGIRTLKNPTNNNIGHRNLLLTGITKAGHSAPSYKIAKKWVFLKDESFNITDKCCDILKKEPLARYEKESKRHPYIGTQASESNQRAVNWINHGCNIISENTHKSRPLSIWDESDIWEYININNLLYCSIYDDVINPNTGEIVVRGEVRTGCAYCAYGANLEKTDTNRFERLKLRKPKQYEKMMNITNNGVRFEDALNLVEVRT